MRVPHVATDQVPAETTPDVATERIPAVSLPNVATNQIKTSVTLLRLASTSAAKAPVACADGLQSAISTNIAFEIVWLTAYR